MSPSAIAPPMEPTMDGRDSLSITGRVFVVGCPRSGTTLLQSILTAHPEVWSLPESHFFEMVEPGRRLARVLGLVSRRGWRAFCQVSSDLGVRLPNRWQIGNWRRKSLTRRFLSLLDANTLTAGKRVWIEKTPNHIFRIPLITQFVPDAKYIHMVRDGRDVVASLYEVTHMHPHAWNGAWGVEKCVDRWNAAIDVTAKYVGEANHLVVTYGRLTSETVIQARRLCRFLGLSPSDDMAGYYVKSASSIVRGHEVWKSNVEREIAARHLNKYSTVFTEQQRQLIERRMSQSVYDDLVASAE